MLARFLFHTRRRLWRCKVGHLRRRAARSGVPEDIVLCRCRRYTLHLWPDGSMEAHRGGTCLCTINKILERLGDA